MSNSSIWPIHMTLSGVTTLGQRGPGSNVNEGVLCFPQSSSITGASSLDCLVSYARHSLGGESFPFADWAKIVGFVPFPRVLALCEM